MDYEGTRDTASEVPMGEVALTRTASDLTGSAAASASAGRIVLMPDANNTVVLPEGVTLDDIIVRGRDLVIQTDDGRTYVIPDGAIFVPEIVAQGVTVPPLNLAALLIGQEPQPAAGPVQSSGGNFAVPVGPLQDAYDLGDLLPYTELAFPQPTPREIFPPVDLKPETGPNATVLLDDDALAGGNPGGTGDDPDAANTSGTLAASGGDGPLTWALSTSGAPAGFSYVANGTGIDIFQSETLVVRVTLNPATGAYTVTQIAVIDHTAGGNENNQAFTLSYTVTDNDGDSAGGTISIDVDDDTPVAANDTDTIAAGTFGPATGNILTDASAGDVGDSDNGADSMGADGGSITAISGFGGAGTIGGTTNGQYGVLTLNADGSYSYVRNEGAPGGVTDTFSYTITDGDGDTATATLTITIADALPITGENATVLLDDDALAGGNPGGTGDDADAANTSGTLAGSGGDGALTWALSTTGAPAGFSYVANGSGIDVFQGATKVLAITLNSATGAYTVTQVAPIDHALGNDENNQAFTLNYTVTDADGDSAPGTLAINVDDDTPVVAADTDTIASGTYGPATGNVLTDADPGDVGDSDTGADSMGADGGTLTAISGFGGAGTIGGTTNGQYGVLTLNADGSYSYVRNAGTPGGVTDTFTYTVTDGDGDTATATLTITIADALPITGENATVLLDDDALAGGNPGGTGDDADAANTSGTLAASGGDGPLTWSLATTGAPAGFSYVANGTGIDVFQGATKVLAITLNTTTGAYTVTQVAPIDHALGGDENNQAFTLSYTVTDQDGDSAPGTLAINVDDDTPVVANDTDSLLAGDTGPATGNVLTDAAPGDAGDGDNGADSLGADGGSVTAITGFGGAGTVGGTTIGQYGTLTLNSDGSYSYVRNGTGPIDAVDVFTYTVTDGDGDTAQATLTITLEDAAPITGENATVLLDDDALAGGNPGGTGDDADAANTSGTLAGSGGDGTLTWALSTTGAPAGFSYVANGSGIDVFQGATLVLQVTLNSATGAYTVTQVAPIDHALGSDENNQAFTLNYTVTDADGDSAPGTLAINVDDDTPIAANDTDSLLSGDFGPATGNILTDASAGDVGDSDTGADSLGADGGSITAITGFGGAGTIGGTTIGQYGTLTLNSDGSYSYTRNAGTPGNVSDVFTYTITDGDGDTATATLTITIEDAAPITGPNATVLLDDDALAGGNPGGTGDDADAANTTGTLAGSGGDGTLTWALSTSGAPAGFSYVANGSGIDVFQGATKVLAITLNSATGAYTVTQVAPIDHALGSDENNQAFTLNYTVTDADGDSAPGTLAINVDDDTPVVAADTDTIASGTYGPATGNILTDADPGDAGDSDNGADSLGADGGTLTAISGFGGAGTIGGTTNGQYGVLTLNADGSYSYVRNAGTPGGVTDTFTYTVTDGDGDTAQTTLTITIADALPLTSANATVLLDDDALAGGNPGGTGDDADAANTSGTLAASGGDGPLTWSLATTGAPAGFSYVANGSGIDVFQGTTLVLQVTLNTATGAYTVTQVAPIDHALGSDENNQAFTLSYTVTDQDGDSAPGTLAINVDDDTPVVAADTDTIASGTYGPATGNVLTDADPGDLGDGDTGADSLGADGGTLTAIIGFGGAGTIGGTTNGQYGVLTLNADGSYSYTRNAGTPGGVTDTFTYTVTDGDGDTAQTTLTITIADALPLTSANATVLLDDDALAGGNPGGTGDDADAANASGTLAASGGDGPLTWSLATTGAPAGFSYVANGTGIDVFQGATKVLAITLNTATGAYTVTQVAPIDHTLGGDENNQAFTLSYTVTDQDGDSAPGTLAINIDDDTPTASASTTQPMLIVDETVLGTDASTSFAGVFTTAFGADGAADSNSITYALGFNAGATGVFDVATGLEVVLSLEAGQVVGRAGVGGPIVFTVSVAGNGTVTLDQQRAVLHDDPNDPDEPGASAVTLSADSLITLTATITDGDGDSTTATANIGQNLQFEDDGPTITSATTPLAIANSGSVSGTGAFVFSTGNDGPAGTDDAIKSVTFDGTVNGVAVGTPTITPLSEDANTATFSFSFTYSTGTSTTATATGTLTFDKVAGTYTVDLDAPIQGFSISGTASGSLFQGYELNSATTDHTQPAVAVTQVNGLFVQFTGVHEPGSGTGADNLFTVNYGQDTTPANDGLAGTFSNGELFSQEASWVSASNEANGVGGDTVGGGEVLDFTLYSSNPQGFVGGTPTASTSTMYLKFDGIGSGEDFIVILKLYNETTGEYTTRALMVQNSDIQKGPGAGPGMFSSITLDNNDGLIVIESNDYNAAGENFVIVGAQIAASDEGITGLAYNFNNTIGDAGGSTTAPLQAFSTDANDGPMKISDIGFVTTNTTDQDAQLTFDVTVQDRDGDTTSQTLVVNIGGVPPVVLDLDGDGAEFLALSAGVAFDYNGDGNAESTAWVGADDGLLAIDLNGDGLVNDGSEIVFGGNGLTDLAGVAASYDSNGDGVLDASDTAFAQFGVWQDANSDGISQEGEFRSLTDMGITSISLTSDGDGYTAADGDVQVFGETTYTTADGTIGTVADAAFATGGDVQRLESRSTELVAASAAATGLLAAMAIEHAAAAADDGLGKAALASETGSEHIGLEPLPVQADTHAQTIAAPALAHAQEATASSAHSGGTDDAATFRAGLDQAVEKVSFDGDDAGNDASKSSLFDAGDHSMMAMDALLSQGAVVASKASAAGQAAVVAALEDSAGAQAVDSIVEHFAAGAPEHAGQSSSFAFDSLLTLGVDGGGSNAMAAQHFAMMQPLDHEQASVAS